MSTPANNLTADLLIEIPKQFPNCRLWRNNRVDAVVTGRGGKPRHIKAGIDGQGDLSGIMAVPKGLVGEISDLRYYVGLRLEIEVKAGKDRLSEAQKSFGKMITDFGGIYIVARSVGQCLEELRRWA